MLEHVEFILGLFVLFYLLLLIYDIASIYSHKNKTRSDEKKKQKIITLLQNSKQATLAKDKKKIRRKILKKLKSLSYLYVFCAMLEENVTIDKEKIQKLFSKPEYQALLVSVCMAYQKKDNLSKSYCAYMLHFIPFKQKEIYEFLYQCLRTKSIYCTENVLLALAHAGNCEAIVEAYLIMSREHVEYGYKLVADGLSKFSGSKEKLCSMLYQNFDQFSEPFKIGFLTFFRQCKYDIGEELYKRIQKSKQEKEVEIEMIRYFSKIKYDKIAKILLDRLENNYYNDFEYDVVMIQTLASYPSKDTIKILKKSLAHYNYYVRYNAAKSLSKMTDISKIKGLTDPFAIEMIQSFISQEV